ncbi:MAG TPA: M56 family metallopeptidase [Actinomycetota bacterium]
MRLALAAGVFVSFALLPHLLRTSLLARGSPMVLAWFGVTSLLGIGAGLFAVLAATVSPGPLPLVDLPRAVEICIGAAGRLLSHPLKHWPSILAAVLFLAAAVRVIAAAVLVARDAKRARPPTSRFPGEERALREHLGIVPSSVRLLPFEGSVAFTTGLVRPVTVVSDGLMRALAPKERSAVIAHERAHASRRHMAALSAARIVARAFGFVPGVLVSVELLVTALEAWADEQATTSVGDPLFVARALATTARLTFEQSAAVASITDGEIGYRIRQLTARRRPRMRRSLVVVLVLATIAMVLAQGAAWSAGQQALTRERLALALHDTCHPPHGPVS